MRFKVLSLLIILMVSSSSVLACRMLGVIARPGQTLGISDNIQELNPFLYDELETLRQQGGSGPWPYNNRDGWGMVTYSRDALRSTAHIVRSEIEAYADSGYFDSTETLLNRESVNLLVGHLRQTSSGATGIENPHPFHTVDEAGVEYCFAHNGDVDKLLLRELIGDEWLSAHPPQTHGGGAWDDEGWYDIVDSELFFFWILKNIELSGDVLSGITTALTTLEEQIPNHVKNFLFSDGTDLYAYRSSLAQDIHYFDAQVGNGDSPWYVEQTNHRAIMSTPPAFGPLTEVPWIPLENRTLLIFRADGTTEFEDIQALVDVSDPVAPTRIVPYSTGFPNPFNGSTTIQAVLRGDSSYLLEIFDIQGRRILKETLGSAKSGELSYVWSGVDDLHRVVNSGQYIYRISGSAESLSGKLLLLK